MRIAVLGGTGTVGRYVVEAARAAGHEAVVISRSRGIDLATGAGLAEALDGAQVAIDTTNITTLRRDTAIKFFTDVSRHLQEAAPRAGVRHLVVLSIVGCDRVPGMGYYEAKVVQERLAIGGAIPASVLRATQFHEFADQMLSRFRRGPVAVVPRIRVQPVAAVTVAEMLVELAEKDATGLCQEMAGPQVRQLPDLTRRLLQHRGERALVVPVPMPGAAGKAQAGGALLPSAGARIAGPTFEEWLATQP